MPIVDGDFEYKIPNEIKESIPAYFYIAFAGELCSVFGFDIFLAQDDGVYGLSYISSTSGWGAALKATCKKLDMCELWEYYAELPWYDSDLFDGELEDEVIARFIKTDVANNSYYQYLIEGGIS